MRAALDQLRSGEVPPALYRLITRTSTRRLLETAATWGWQGVHFDGKIIQDKQTFLIEAGSSLRYPAYYGQNWDACEEMINDLSWLPAPGYLIVYTQAYRFAAAHPSEWAIARDILTGAVRNWQGNGIPFVVLLRHAWWTNRDLPRLDLVNGKLDGKGNTR